MSKKKKPKALTAVACTSSLDASTSDASLQTISKTQKRKLQKKKAKLAARAERAAEEQARAERKAKEKAERAKNAPAASEPHPIPQPLAFAADEDDHCETAPEAYQDVAQMLLLAAEQLGKTPASLRIYDPYYCNAAVVRHLGALGFSEVYNRNEDFYAALEAGSIPEHDIVVTNPPYSGAHPERLLRFLEQNGKPWLALMPNWVCDRDYCDPSSFYLVPKSRYHYWTPRGRRADVVGGGSKAKTHGHTNAALGVRTSPFVSFWYCGHFTSHVRKQLQSTDRCRLFWSREELPPSVRDCGRR